MAISKKNMAKLVEIINQEFGKPFLKKNMVQATLEKTGNMTLVIGTRDIEINAKLEVVNAGTFMR